MEYASKAVGNSALGLSIGALGLEVLKGGLNGILGNAQTPAAGNDYVTRETLDMAMKLAEKDSKIALLEAIQTEETKIADVYERVMTRVNADKQAQSEVNAAQAVYNATNGATVSVLNSQVAQLMSMCRMYVPAENVTPAPMPQFNSWTAPTT